jgi:hypothetical protein
MNAKYGKRRKGWLKLHVTIDSKSINILNFEITVENVHDSEEFESLVKPIIEKTMLIYWERL